MHYKNYPMIGIKKYVFLNKSCSLQPSMMGIRCKDAWSVFKDVYWIFSGNMLREFINSIILSSSFLYISLPRFGSLSQLLVRFVLLLSTIFSIRYFQASLAPPPPRQQVPCLNTPSTRGILLLTRQHHTSRHHNRRCLWNHICDPDWLLW